MALPDTLLDCKVCHDIWRAFAGDRDVHDIKLGPFEDAVSSKCPRHTPLVEHFRDYCVIDDDNISVSNDVGIYVNGGIGLTGIGLTESLSRGGRYWDLLLAKQNSIPDHIGTGNILDPDWVDLDIVKLWKNQCLGSHGPKCENPMKIWPTRPAWLVDVENKCVVSGHGRGPYVALSYRCGENLRFRAGSDTMAELQKPNSLDSPEISVHLTPVLKHAMYLVSTIGERYLWVDTLCIVLGDDAATAEQLNLMSAIYASAIITIIAADGDSQDGLLGLRDVSAPRNLEQRIFPFGQEKIIVQNVDMFSLSGGTPYFNRGWGFQEHKMSSRKIWFNRKEVHWECQCNVWHEEMIPGTEFQKYIDPRLGVIMGGFPDMGSLTHLLSDYNNRELYYEEDALPAISGLLSVFSRSFTGGFLYGLSEMLFDRQLGWKPQWSHTNLRRRVQSDRPSSSQLSHLCLPSWSWIGWQGMTANGYGEAARINDRQNWIEETIPITKWYTSSSPSGSPSRRIRSTWFEDRDAFKDIAKPLLAGWTRHKMLADDSDVGDVGGPRLYPDGCNGYVFEHCNMPDDDRKYWYFPFPVADIQESTPPFTPDQTSYIFCETKRAHLWAHQAGDENLLNICDKAGRRVGSLHLHNQRQLEPFPKTVADDTPGMQIELVAIYRSRRYENTWNEERERYTHPQVIKESYEVLWVEWVDGVAYRLASGHVWKADWEESDLEDVSLILH